MVERAKFYWRTTKFWILMVIIAILAWAKNQLKQTSIVFRIIEDILQYAGFLLHINKQPIIVGTGGAVTIKDLSKRRKLGQPKQKQKKK